MGTGNGKGRPTKYKPEYNETARLLSVQGKINPEIATALGIGLSTFQRWMVDRPDFRDAIKAGKQVADDFVERSLYERAMGYSHPEEKIFLHEGKEVRVETQKHYPPDPASMIFWLTNRRPDEWRHKREISGPNGGPIPVGMVDFRTLPGIHGGPVIVLPADDDEPDKPLPITAPMKAPRL